MPHNISNKIIEKLVQNLQSHNDIMAQLCGTRKGQLGLKPEVLRAYLVGLAHISPSHTGTLELSKATEPGGSLEKYLVFPRTSLAQTPLEHFQQQQKGHLRENDNIFGAVRVKAIPLKDSGDEIYEPTTEITPGLFGFHMASPDCTQIILAGREMDALAAYQQTGIPAVSLPGGSYQLPLNAIGALDRFEKIYIWLDDNCQGHDAAEKMAKKLGIDRCLIVRPTMHKANRPMNASEALITKASFQELLDDAKPVRHEQIMDFSSLRDAVFYEVMNPDQVKGVQSVCFPGFNQTLKGLRPGELTVLTGPTGVGKTTVLSQLSLDFCQSGVSTLWGSFEVPNVRLVSRMINQFAKKDLTGNAKGFEEWGQKFERLPMYFLKFHGSTQPSTVLETMKHAVYAYDVKHVIIDNLQFMMSMQGRGMDKYDAQDQAIATFRQFATNEQVHVTVVVHARKEQQSQGPLDINSVFGSAKITQEADNVIAIQRYGKTDNRTRYFEVLKNRFDGTLGKVYYRYDPKTISISQIEAPRKSSSRDIEIYKSADSLK
ncbi:hypothetical protein H4219_005328 [Mycoemilia scoparia]|uniref:SF4 helicase domain-containing protein n=1 Tax=Mycoemilia scoparia TaxID=417184 RepID=A0A9W8DPI4_9FUNG|nr:hypothetical protein H4219_005328 [Mycoemilia scoparia]